MKPTGGGFRLDEPQQITLPYTATRNCFINMQVHNTGDAWYYYLGLNGVEANTLSFSGSNPLGYKNSIYFPLKQGNTISLKNKGSNGTLTVSFYVM